MPGSQYLVGSVTWYGVLVVAGMAAATFLAMREEKRVGLPRDTMIDLALFLLPCGVLGARLYYVLFAWREYAAQPLRALYIWEGGLAIYGGIIAGAAVVLIFAYKRRLPLLTLLDCIVPGVALAQGIGRWGNFFNQEAYGVLLPEAFQFFPAGVLIDGSWHMATFFYESAADILIFAWLWHRRTKRTRPGDTFLTYLLLYGSVRAVIEGLRTDSLYGLIAGLRVSQAFSILLVMCVCVLTARRTGTRRKLWLALPAAALVLSAVLAAANARLALRTAALILYGAAAIVCVAFLRLDGGKPCPAEESKT